MSFWGKVDPIIRRLIKPQVFAPLATAIYLAVSFLILSNTVHTTDGRADLVSGDTGHYLSIAKDLARGDFDMDYVKAKPHRQPLYPALLAPIFWAKGQDLFVLAAVNVILATLGFLVLYFAIWRLYDSHWIPAVAGFLYLANPFLLAQTTRHLLTEPLHIFLMLVIIYSFLAYLKRGGFGFVVIAGAATGLDYLARPNGLFVFASLLVVLALWEVCRSWPQSDRWLAIIRRGIPYLGIVALFLVITTPSWLPRWKEYHSPFYHGYLSNYMWVDTYKEGHVGQREAKYTWRDYARTHTVWDATKRMAWGVWRICFAIPWTIEDQFPLLILFATLGVIVALRRGPPEYRFLALFALIQILPLMWTTISNPNVRVPYASTLPFEVAFAAAFLAATPFLIAKFYPLPRSRAVTDSASAGPT